MASVSDQSDFDELCGLVAEEVARLRVPGFAIGLLKDGEEFSAGFGVTNVDHPLAVDGETLFQIGSITKTFVATAAMRLVEDGRLDLDAPIRRYLPDLRLADAEVANSVTSRHLLTHTGGWLGDYFSDTGRGDDALARYVAELADVEQMTPLGTVYSYCNSGFCLMGRVIEVLTRETFEAALQRLVLAPLGLERSFVFPEDVMTHRFASGHADVGGHAIVLRPWQLPRSATPAGGIIASVRELLRYARFQLEDGQGLLSHESIHAMRQPLVPSTGLPDRAVGLAWNIAPGGINHSGGTYGQRAFLLVCPDKRLALAEFGNSRSADRVMLRVGQWVGERLLGLPRQETPAAFAADADALDGCVGVYEGADRLEVGRLGDALVVREIDLGGFPTKGTPPPPGPPPPLIRMGFYADDRLVGLDPPFTEVRAEVIRGEDSQVDWLRFRSRIHRRVR